MLRFIGGVVFIFVLAFVIIKLSINTKENPDFSLGILEHPSTYIKPDIEFVYKSLEVSNFQNKI